MGEGEGELDLVRHSFRVASSLKRDRHSCKADTGSGSSDSKSVHCAGTEMFDECSSVCLVYRKVRSKFSLTLAPISLGTALSFQPIIDRLSSRLLNSDHQMIISFVSATSTSLTAGFENLESLLASAAAALDWFTACVKRKS